MPCYAHEIAAEFGMEHGSVQRGRAAFLNAERLAQFLRCWSKGRFRGCGECWRWGGAGRFERGRAAGRLGDRGHGRREGVQFALRVEEEQREVGAHGEGGGYE